MQEVSQEASQKGIRVAVKVANLSARTIKAALKKALTMLIEHQKHPKGKQSLKTLIKQGQGVSNIDVDNGDLRGLSRAMLKKGLKIHADKTADGKYLIYFQSPNADVMTAAFNEYTNKKMRKAERPSVLQMLSQFKSRVAEQKDRQANRGELER